MAQIFKNAKAALADAETLIYTCPSGATAIVIGAQIANTDNANPCNLQIWWTDASDTNAQTSLGYDISIPAKSVYEPFAGKFVLDAGDSVYALGSTHLSLEASVSILELS